MMEKIEVLKYSFITKLGLSFSGGMVETWEWEFQAMLAHGDSSSCSSPLYAKQFAAFG